MEENELRRLVSGVHSHRRRRRGDVAEVGKDPKGRLIQFAPLVAEPPTESITAMSSAIVRAYEEIPLRPSALEEWDATDGEVTVLARFDGRTRKEGAA